MGITLDMQKLIFLCCVFLVNKFNFNRKSTKEENFDRAMIYLNKVVYIAIINISLTLRLVFLPPKGLFLQARLIFREIPLL